MKIQGIASGIETAPIRPIAGIQKKDEATPPSSPAAAAPIQPAEKSSEMERLAAEVQRHFKDKPSKLDISLDKDLNMIVTKVLEEDSGKVIRQFPPETVIEVMKVLKSQRGMIVNEKG